MAITLATPMLWSRIFQVASCLIILGTNGFLIHLISSRRLGLNMNMIVLQIMATLVLFYTLISILALHICRKSVRTYWIIAFIAWDLIFTGVCIGMISIYSFAGVPSDCGGLTRENWGPGDAPNNPHPGFSTVRFSHGLFGAYGELDIYCGLPKTDYAFVVILIFTYTLNVILSVLRILSFQYMHKAEVTKLCEEAELKGKGSYSDLASLITRVSSYHTPPSNLPTHTSPPSSPAPSFHSSPVSRDHYTQIHASPISTHPPAQVSNLHLPDDTDEMNMADGLVSNGSRGESQNSTTNLPPYIPDLEANRPSAGNSSPLGSYGKDQDFPGLR